MCDSRSHRRRRIIIPTTLYAHATDRSGNHARSWQDILKGSIERLRAAEGIDNVDDNDKDCGL